MKSRADEIERQRRQQGGRGEQGAKWALPMPHIINANAVTSKTMADADK